jgi:S-adenosylmethionine:tRNA ribosyltransferase-isomerase
MLAAHLPYQRYPGAKLLAADREGALQHVERARFANLLRPGDLVVANDAATMPASLAGQHVATGEPIEVRLAGRGSLAADAVRRFSAVVFGAGDFHQRTEDRPLPPPLRSGDRLRLGPLTAVVERVLAHPRLIALRFEGLPDEIWAGIARHGRPIQYAHVAAPLALWDVWTPIAGPPVAFEPPSAGFAIDWRMLGSLAAGGAGFATITHAAGISSTGDPGLDALLPFDEPYRIPEATAEAIRRVREGGGRVIAIGTTVVRALEHRAAGDGCVSAGEGLATQCIGVGSRLRVVDAILSGTHHRGTSHYELLRAFADDATLRRMEAELDSRGYRTHEFGDSVFLEAAHLHGRCLAKTGRSESTIGLLHSMRTCLPPA